MPKPNPKDIDLDQFAASINEESVGGTARGISLVSAASIDALLRHMIVSKLVNSTHSTDLFDSGNAPLGSFSAKINMAFSLGLITQEERNAIDAFRDIRNEYAHHVNVDLGTHKMQDRIDKMTKNLKFNRTDLSALDDRMLVRSLCLSIFARLKGRTVSEQITERT